MNAGPGYSVFDGNGNKVFSYGDTNVTPSI
jgi:hypothetical protein